ncbi:MAG: V-type ATPase 116kDa subunit family protein, partial [Eubacteriales bacterium]
MAIINAKRVTVIGLSDEKAEIVKSLQSLGAVQIEHNTFSEVDLLETAEGATETEQRLSDIQFALSLVKPYDETKKPLLAGKPAIDKQGLDAFQELERKQMIAIESLKELSEELNWARASITRAKNIIAQVEPYGNFDDTFDALGKHNYTSATLGVMPAENKEAFIDEMQANDGLVSFEILEEFTDNFVAFVVMHDDVAKEIRNALKGFGFSEAKFEHYEDSPQGIIDKEVKEIVRLSEKKAEVKMQIAAFIGQIADMECLEDYYSAKLQREKAALSFGYTKNAFVLEGWIDEHSQDAVKKAIAEVSDAAVVQFRDPLEDEEYPTIIENPKLARPFEAITEMYDTPSAAGIDPNLLMAPFYFIVFGMMVSDAGYGLILALACTFVLWKTKPAGMFGKILGVVAFGGVSTFIWGVLFGGWFGVSAESLPG